MATSLATTHRPVPSSLFPKPLCELRALCGEILLMPVPRKIIAFHQDEQSHWVADLDCGHTQHVRHDPPWTLRPWVLTPEGRASHLGQALPCKKCDADPPDK